jgi:hypothetical protein
MDFLRGGKRSENIVFDNRKMKLTDPITRNEKGEIIPISKRDNFSSPSILMGSVPAILSLGAIKSGSNNTITNNQK